MGYRHLNIDERESILKMQAAGKSFQDMAENLGRNKGTISRIPDKCMIDQSIQRSGDQQDKNHDL